MRRYSRRLIAAVPQGQGVPVKQTLRSPNSPIYRLLVFSLKHSIVIVALAIAVIAAGLVAAWRLPVEVTGAEPLQIAQLVARYPGHSAEEIERTIAIPIERALQDLPQVKISSVSRPDWAVITLSYSSSDDEARLREQVRGKLENLALPPGVNTVMLRVPPDQ
jgi:cobalt-zinc-cadmium resistance protein CzcA